MVLKYVIAFFRNNHNKRKGIGGDQGPGGNTKGQN